MTADGGDVLVIGYGNPGRMDDGLGPATIDELEKLAIDGVDLDADYQLTVEDAAAVAGPRDGRLRRRRRGRAANRFRSGPSS